MQIEIKYKHNIMKLKGKFAIRSHFLDNYYQHAHLVIDLTPLASIGMSLLLMFPIGKVLGLRLQHPTPFMLACFFEVQRPHHLSMPTLRKCSDLGAMINFKVEIKKITRVDSMINLLEFPYF